MGFLCVDDGIDEEGGDGMRSFRFVGREGVEDCSAVIWFVREVTKVEEVVKGERAGEMWRALGLGEDASPLEESVRVE
jgi:hypothetical protein